MTNYISTGCEGRTCKSQTGSPIPAGDDQYPGQRAGEVEEEIRILDSSPAYRWEGGREGSVGCDARQSSSRSVGEGAAEGGWRGLDDSQLFFVDTRETASYWDYWMYSGAISYHRLDEGVLGETEPADNRLAPQSASNPRCFNCGSTGHLLSSCPDPRNRPLIDLSRQFFAFFASDTSQNLGRIHEVEGWKSRRLEWTRVYKGRGHGLSVEGCSGGEGRVRSPKYALARKYLPLGLPSRMALLRGSRRKCSETDPRRELSR